VSNVLDQPRIPFNPTSFHFSLYLHSTSSPRCICLFIFQRERFLGYLGIVIRVKQNVSLLDFEFFSILTVQQKIRLLNKSACRTITLSLKILESRVVWLSLKILESRGVWILHKNDVSRLTHFAYHYVYQIIVEQKTSYFALTEWQTC